MTPDASDFPGGIPALAVYMLFLIGGRHACSPTTHLPHLSVYRQGPFCVCLVFHREQSVS